MRRLQGLKWLAIAAVAAIGPAGASELGGSRVNCPEGRSSVLRATVSDWPGEGSFFNLGTRSPILMP